MDLIKEGNNGAYGTCPYCGEFNDSCTVISTPVTYECDEFGVIDYSTETQVGARTYSTPTCVNCGKELPL